MRLAPFAATIALALTIIAPSAQASNADRGASLRYVIEALSNNCQYRDEPDCVNVAVTADVNLASGQSRWCVSTQDNRVPGPPAAAGCATSASIRARGQGIVIPEMAVPSILANDCPPGEECQTTAVEVRASAAFSAIGKGVKSQTVTETVAGSCVTRAVITTFKVDVTGSVTVDGFTYALPGTDPLAHHRSATMTRIATRSFTYCN